MTEPKDQKVIKPHEYADLYLKMKFPLDAGKIANVTVKDYQNPGSTNKKNTAKPVPASIWNNVLGKFDAHINKYGRTIYSSNIPEKVTRACAQRVHIGCGSPDEIKTVLQLVHFYWKDLKGDVGTLTPDLQTYVDNYIGLYCTGFVGNYTVDVLKTDYKTRGPQTYIPSWATNTSALRTSLRDVRENDVLVWVSGIHINILERPILEGTEITLTGGPTKSSVHLECRVVESSLDSFFRGLTNSLSNIYTIEGGKTGEAKPGGKFTVTKRGLNYWQTADVYIISPTVS